MSAEATAPIGQVFVDTLRLFAISRRWMLLISTLALVSSAFAAVVPIALGRLVDELAAGLPAGKGESHGAAAALWMISSLALCLVLREALRIWYGYQVTKLTNELMIRARYGIAQRSFDSSGAEDRRTDKTYMLTSDVPQIAALYSQPLTTVVSDLLDTLFMSVAIASMSIVAFGIVALPCIPICLVAARAGARQRRLATEIRADESRSLRLTDRVLRNMVIVRLFGGESRQQAAINRVVSHLGRGLSGVNANLAQLMTSIGVLRLGATILALWYMVHAVGAGNVAVGDIATVMMYLTRFYSPAINLSKVYQSVQRGAVSTARIAAYLKDAPAERTVVTPQAHRGQASLRTVGLQTRLENGSVLPVPDFAVDDHGLVLLLGASGVGKSSLLRAVIGLDAGVLEGSLIVNGIECSAAAGEDRFRYFSFAGQENEVIGDSVMDAVVYPVAEGGPETRRGQRALRRLGIEGLADRPLGDDAIPVSGGEARRIVLARALTRTAPILVADEVTSNLDAETVAVVERVLVEESRERIVIVAAHHPSPQLRDEANTILTF